jgi:AcrR family transcriptional regulator
MASTTASRPRPPAGAGSAPPRRTQAERSAATQTRVLEAALEVLLERGYSGLTTTRVAERAGVSRGAQLHQYPTKEALVVAAVDHVTRCWGDELRRQATVLPAGGDERLLRVHELLWTVLSGPIFYSALELWVAGRTDPVLRETLLPFERAFIRGTRALVAEMYGPELAGRPRAREAIDILMHTMRGAALAQVLQRDRPAVLDLRLLTDIVVGLLAEDAPRPH